MPCVRSYSYSLWNQWFHFCPITCKCSFPICACLVLCLAAMQWEFWCTSMATYDLLAYFIHEWLASFVHACFHSVNFEMLSFREQRMKRGMEILHWSWSELEVAITDLAYDRRRLYCMVRRVLCFNELSISCLIGLVLGENFAGKSDVCFGLWWHIPILFQSWHLGRARGLGYIEVVESYSWKEKLLPLQFDRKVSALIPLDDQVDLEALADAESQVCFLAIRWEWLCWCSSWTCWKWT